VAITDKDNGAQKSKKLRPSNTARTAVIHTTFVHQDW